MSCKVPFSEVKFDWNTKKNAFGEMEDNLKRIALRKNNSNLINNSIQKFLTVSLLP